MINGNVDVVSIPVAKIDASFLSAQFVLYEYHPLYPLDIGSKNGSIFVNVKSSNRLSCENMCNPLQTVPFGINLRREKWLLIPVYRNLCKTVDIS